MTYTYSSSSCTSSSRSLSAGKYLLELWGASGGSSTTSQGGYGGYSKGILTLTFSTTVYIYLGGQGQSLSATSYRSTFVSGGCNGGGRGYTDSYSSGLSVTSGGTDIRIGGTSMKQRVIVAGGGGGAGVESNSNGGNGGGLNGGDGSGSASYSGKGGNQTSGGTTCVGGSTICQSGSFGYGGNSSTTTYITGGGGGFYGGSTNYYAYGAGGGSGFVFTTTYSSISLSSCYFLTDASTGTNTWTGHGKAVITTLQTFVDPSSMSYFIFPLNRRVKTLRHSVYSNLSYFHFITGYIIS